MSRRCLIAAVLLSLCQAAVRAQPAAEAARPPSAPTGAAAVPAQPSDLEGWQRKHEALLARARQGGIDVLFLGDSITQGWRDAGRDVWAKHFAQLGAANFGVAADRTEHVLWRITHGELDGISPRLVVLMIGTNDLAGRGTARPPEQVAASVGAILAQIEARLPRSRVLLLGILPRQPQYEWFPARRKAANELLAKLADGRRVTFLDFGAKFLGPDGTADAALMPDLLHPNARGYEVWAEAMMPTLLGLLRRD